jgi:hypothetical protein
MEMDVDVKSYAATAVATNNITLEYLKVFPMWK